MIVYRLAALEREITVVADFVLREPGRLGASHDAHRVVRAKPRHTRVVSNRFSQLARQGSGGGQFQILSVRIAIPRSQDSARMRHSESAESVARHFCHLLEHARRKPRAIERAVRVVREFFHDSGRAVRPLVGVEYEEPRIWRVHEKFVLAGAVLHVQDPCLVQSRAPDGASQAGRAEFARKTLVRLHVRLQFARAPVRRVFVAGCGGQNHALERVHGLLPGPDFG